MTVPGIGPIISSAMVAAIRTGDVFSKGRDFGAWLGLVPKQISTGDRTILGCLRHSVLLVFGAPCQLRLLAGQEHGRTIPLADNSQLFFPTFTARPQPP
jgi:transposase